jgi:plastocyanin domain-containing protein
VAPPAGGRRRRASKISGFAVCRPARLVLLTPPIIRLGDEASAHSGVSNMPSKLLVTALLLSAPLLATAQSDQKAGKAIEISVTKEGFVPSTIKVKKGEKVKLLVTRKVERTCATEIVIRDQGINQPLPLNKPVTVEFTPSKSGQLRYACGMDMISGVILVE